MDKKTWLLILGFLIFMLGAFSLVIALVGGRISFLSFLDAFGYGTGFFLKIVLCIIGLVLVVLSNSLKTAKQ